MRDYLDTVVLFERLGEHRIVDAFRSEADEDREAYPGIRPPWNDWRHLAARGRHWAERLAPIVFEGPG